VTKDSRGERADVVQIVDNAGQRVILAQHPCLVCPAEAIDTLGESRTERVGAGALHDIGEGTRIKDHHGKIGENWGSLSTTVDIPVIFFADGTRRGIRREVRSGTMS